MIELTATILTALRLTDVESGHALFELWTKYFPDQIPQRFGDHEPLEFCLKADNLQGIERAWGSGAGFIAERREPRVTIFVQYCLPSFRRQRHSSISVLRLQVDDRQRIERFRRFVCEVVEIFMADYASAHVLTRGELADRLKNIETSIRAFPNTPGPVVAQQLKDRVDREGFGSVLWSMRPHQVTFSLAKCLPDLSWLTVFGKPYIDMFERDRILTAPAHRVDELSGGAIALTLTDGIEDSQKGWDLFKSACSDCKVHLGANAFCDFEGGPHRAPQFNWLTGQSDKLPVA